MTAPLRLLVLSLIVFSATDAPASFTLVREDIPIEGQELDRDRIFARVDSLWGVYDAATGVERGRLARRLAELHLATGLTKHRPRALELLEEAAQYGADPQGAVELLASTQQRMRFVGEARESFHRLTEIAADDPRVFMDLGRFEFLEARRRVDLHTFREAARAFARASALDPDDPEAWFGLSAASLAARAYDTASRAAHELLALRPDWPTALLLSAAADEGRGAHEEAWKKFHMAFGRLDPHDAAVFTRAEGFVNRGDLVRVARTLVPREELLAGYARVADRAPEGAADLVHTALRDSTVRSLALSRFLDQNDDRPAQDYRIGHMRFWTRLVEADVLFSDPETGQRGWNTPMGESIVRWGRPTKTYYHPGAGSIMDVVGALDFAFPSTWSFNSGVAQMVWGYDDRPNRFSLVFYDEFRQDRFTYSEQTGKLLHVMANEMPIDLPADEKPEPPFTIALSRAVFPRGWDKGVIETYVGLRPRDLGGHASDSFASADTVAVLEWALFDAEDRRIDHRKEILDHRSRQSTLQTAAGEPTAPQTFEPWMTTIGARLDAGRYRIAVELSTPDGATHHGATLNVTVPHTRPPTELEMSDLQLATLFERYDASSDVPLQFVKYGQVILTAPDLRIPTSSSRMGVYFEVRHLGLDDAGRTHFDVTYEVFAGERRSHDVRMASADFVAGDLERVEPLSMQFLEERTGVSSEGLVVKGTSLDVSGLVEGDYVLRVTIRDLIARREASRTLPFRKTGL